MRKFIYEHLIEDGEEKIFDSEKEAVKYALTMHSKYKGTIVVVVAEISAQQLIEYQTHNVPIPCTAYRREIWRS